MPTLHWVGKDKVVNHHHDVPFRLLDKQYTFTANEGTPTNSTDNRIIHGDNLEALKSLLPEFEGKVNCIYIDPPYNTGNEGWVYNDAVNDPKIKKWLGQVVGKEGEDLSRHDKWLCMMYPRLKLLHRLLADDGVIFVSIDDNEVHTLRLMMDEIFGTRNFVAQFAWQKAYSPRMDAKLVSWDHDHVVCYGKSGDVGLNRIKFEQNTAQFSNFDEATGKHYRRRQWRKEGSGARREDRPNLYYSIKAPDGMDVFPIRPDGSDGRWRGQQSYFDQLVSVDAIEWVKQNNVWQIYVKQFSDVDATQPPSTWWDSEKFGHNHKAAEEIRELLGANSFPTPKPTQLIQRILEMATQSSTIILDSFAGSGTTAHAVLKLNAQDGGNRRFILCEMMDYAETITAERVRRVMNGYGEGAKAVAGTGGTFDYYTVGAPLFKEDKNLNEDVGDAAIRDYVAYTESIPPALQCGTDSPVNQVSKYVLGTNNTVLWIFYYERDRITTLNLDFLASLNIKALLRSGGKIRKRPEQFVIYADKCALDKDFLTKHGITFKRIPRDITRL